MSIRGRGRTRPEVLWRFIRNFSDVPIVCAHWGGGLPFYGLMPEVKEGLDRAYFDTAATSLLYDAWIFETVASAIGPERILMGSDYPLVRARTMIGQVESSGLSRSAKDMVLGGNAARLLGNFLTGSRCANPRSQVTLHRVLNHSAYHTLGYPVFGLGSVSPFVIAHSG